MNAPIGENVLITTDQWFYAPNGEMYRAVWGELKAVHDSFDLLGVKTNSKSTNWYIEVGNMMIAGCQVHYAVGCPNKPNLETSSIEGEHGGKPYCHIVHSRIYNANER